MNRSITPSSPETLRQAFARVASDLNNQAPAMTVPAAVWAAMPPPAKPESARRRGWRFAWAGGGLAMATLSVAVALLVTAPVERLPAPQAELSTAFMPVGSAERWPQLMRDARENGRAWVVPTELPSESLAAMGLPYDPARAGESVRAELLVHASGDVLAVRFVR